MGTNKDLAISVVEVCLCVLAEPENTFALGRAFRCQGPINKVVVNNMKPITTMMATILLLLPMAMAGVNDTVDQLRNGFTIVPLSDQVDSKPCKISLLHLPHMALITSIFLQSSTKLASKSSQFLNSL